MAYKNQIKTTLLHFVIILALLLSATGIRYLLRGLKLPEANIAIVFFLAALLTSLSISSYVFAILASVLATFPFNFLFTEPCFSFTVNAPSCMITLFIMSIAVLLTSTVMFHVGRNECSARGRKLESRALYALTNLLTDAKTFPEVAELAADTVSKSVCTSTVCLYFDENDKPEDSYIQYLPGQAVRHRTEDTSGILQRLSDLDAGLVAGSVFYDWPIYAKGSTLGLIRLPKGKAQRLSPARVRIPRSMIGSIALAMDRFRASQQRICLHEETVQKRYRASLLCTVSHDLRTPLAGVVRTSGMLLGMTDSSDPRYSLMEGIHHDAGWLHPLVENILSLTHLQDGMLAISKQMEAAEEILGGAARYVMRHHPGYDIEVHVSEELSLVPVDTKLISRTLISLLENAIGHTDPPGEICVSVEEDKGNHSAVFSVRDHGSGIGGTDLPHIFELFYTSHAKESDSRKGVGLGLTICDTIVKAHGGTIWTRNHADDPGAEFVFGLPLEEENHG